MAWAPGREPVTSRRGWSTELTPELSGPALGWEPVMVRSAAGQEVVVLVDAGVVGADLSGVDLAVAHDAGLVVVPDLDGRDAASVLESGRVVSVVRGEERIGARDRSTAGMAFRRVETVKAHDSGIGRPGAVRGFEVVGADDSGRVRVSAARGDERTAAHDSGVGGFPTYPYPNVSTVSATTTMHIPPDARYIDVIILGGGGGGAGGSQGAPGWDGNGGQAGQYQSFRWDRGPGGTVWTDVSFVIGGGGTGGSRNSGTGGAGGTTNAWIVGDPLGDPNLSRAASGGAGGSGTSLGGGVSGAQNGNAPGNHTFQGITATGGGQNSGTPGGGGKGGTGSFWPTNPGSGSTGARGQAWVRFS